MLTRQRRQQRDGLLRGGCLLGRLAQVAAHGVGDRLPLLGMLPGEGFQLLEGGAVGVPIRVGHIGDLSAEHAWSTLQIGRRGPGQ